MMEPTKVDIMHIVYIVIIAGIVILAIWLCSPYMVPEESLAKFEFAATITSIVLAVVSISYSIYSGQGVSQNLGSMRDASAVITTVGKDLGCIKDNLNDDLERLSRIERQMKVTQDGIIQIIRNTDFIKDSMKPVEANLITPNAPHVNEAKDDIFVFTKTSIVGKCIIYACMLSNERNRPFPATIVGNPSYVHGYITALETCAPSHFRAAGKANGHIEVSYFDKNFFKDISGNGIQTEINSNGLYAEMNTVMQKIHSFFRET